MKTFLIQAANYSCGGAKFWAEKFIGKDETEAKTAFYNKYGVYGWIRFIAEIKN